MNAAIASEDQATLWNGSAGQAWIDAQAALDQMFRPVEALLVETARAASARSVLDVGCGTGGTTLALARALGAQAQCLGADVSAPMIEVARAGAEREKQSTQFICADAQRHVFEASAFDLIVSRFGVMFFDDPVRAFANLRHAARTDAGLCAIAWRGTADNPFMSTAERAAAPLLPELPARRPDAPGQFAFADRARVQGILEGSGWRDIDIRAVDFDCRFPESALRLYLSRLGPVGRVLQELDATRREQVLAVIRAAFEPYVRGAEVRFSAACWQILARA